MHRLPPHISYTLLHFLNMTRAAPRDSTRSRCFRTLLVEGGSVALLCGAGEGEARFEGLRAKHHSICKISRVAEAKQRVGKQMKFAVENNARNFWTVLYPPLRPRPQCSSFYFFRAIYIPGLSSFGKILDDAPTKRDM